MVSQVFTIPEVALMAVFGSHGQCCKGYISNGNAREGFSRQAVSTGRGVGLEDCSFPLNARDAKDGMPSEGRSPRRSPSISNSAWTQLPPKERATPLNMTCWIRKSRICKEELGPETTSGEWALVI